MAHMQLAHLMLHVGVSIPDGPRAARDVERQAFRFAAALLAPAEGMLEELETNNGRVTLKLLAAVKARWGISLKMLVGRYKDLGLGVIDEAHARSLYKQISARGWNKEEPVEVPNEDAIWLRSALGEPADDDLCKSITVASKQTYLDRWYFENWIDWTPTRRSEGDEAVADAHRPALAIHVAQVSDCHILGGMSARSSASVLHRRSVSEVVRLTRGSVRRVWSR